MPLAHVAGLHGDGYFKDRLRHVDGDRCTLHPGSSFHRHLWTQGDFGTSMPFKSREESIPSLERAGTNAPAHVVRASAGRSAPSRYATEGHWSMVASRMVSRVVALGLAAVILANSQVISLAGQPDTPPWVNDLNRLAQYLGRSVPADELGTIGTARTSERPEIRAFRAALLYRADPVKWGSELSSTFSIHDYAQRARGEANDITQQEFISRIKDLESRYPALQPMLVLLVAFVQFRDANLWFPQGDQRVSVARFFRGAFLAQVFKGSRLDAISVANQLDHDARQEFELGLKGKQ